MPLKLTKKVVDSEGPAKETRIVWDTALKGFGLIIRPSGVKSYCVRYRAKGSGRDVRMVLGRHGVLTPDTARSRT